jgi:hypothetical protein
MVIVIRVHLKGKIQIWWQAAAGNTVVEFLALTAMTMKIIIF